MTPDDKTNLIVRLALERGWAFRRLSNIAALLEQHPIHVPTEALRRELLGENNPQEQK